MRLIIALVAVATLAWLLLATRGKDCHYNTHLKNRVSCTKPER